MEANKQLDHGRRSPAISYAIKTPGDALHSATERGDLVGITRILQASSDCVDARNARGRTSLHVAARIGRTDIVKHLLQYGADVNGRSGWEYTPLIFAAENLQPGVIVTLVRAGAQLEAKTKNGDTALHRAVLRRTNKPDTVYALAVLGADVNAKNQKGDTPIYTSVSRGMDVYALVLCAFGADPTAKSSRGDNAAELVQRRESRAKTESRVDISQVISTWTAGANMQKYRQHLLRFVREEVAMDLSAVLCWASSKGHEGIVNFVLQVSEDDSGSFVNSAETMRGWTPLHHAAAGGESGIAKILLTHGATVDPLTRSHKWTPLLLAAEKGRQRTVGCLLESGANVLAKTHDGKTAFELAGSGGHSKTLSILGEQSIRLDNHVQQEEALERHKRAKIALERSDGVEVVVRGPKKPASRSTGAITGSTDTQRVSESEIKKTNGGSFLMPGAELVQGSQDGSRDSSPSGLTGGTRKLTSGSFDGVLYSSSSNSSDISQSSAFDKLLGIWDYFDYKPKHDRPIKIAILDTGLDISHSDLNQPRIIRFQNSQPLRAEGEPYQRDRIQAWKDFTQATSVKTKTDMLDLDGHGTQVAGLILRLAPRSDLYIARICEGDVSRGGSMEPTESSDNPFKKPQPETAAAAVTWAIDQQVDIINLSFGFSSRPRDPALKYALRKAAACHILVFAAMSNGGNDEPHGAAWPANDGSLTIGIHSCARQGRRFSDFTPRPVVDSCNFMVEGEQVWTHWPEAKGGGFRSAKGTSFATPVAVSMAALILAFERQHLCKKDREETEQFVDLDELRELNGMSRVLRKVSVSEDKYHYIYPRLLWNDLDQDLEGDRNKVRKHAWDIIRKALSR